MIVIFHSEFGTPLDLVALAHEVCGIPPMERAASFGFIRDTCPQCLDRVHPEALVLTDAGVRCEDCAEEAHGLRAEVVRADMTVTPEADDVD